MGGISFANVLIFMQLGFVNLFAGGAILRPKHLKGDLFITNAEAKLINSFSTFDRTRLYQATAFDGIISAEPLYLKDINIQLPPGEITTLTGPSGSGKTTLLTLIGALRSMKTGSFKVLDRPPIQLRQDKTRQPPPDPGFTSTSR